ncbi:MAG: glycosyltransferase, partial [Flavobacteriales bacterium]
RSGWLPQDELASVLAAAGGLVFIPWFEGFGIPLLEAFSAGTPTIHSDRTSLPEVSAGAGLQVDPGDAEAVASAMLRLEREPALREQLVERGHDRAEAFSWERTASLMWDCLVRAGEAAGVPLGPKSEGP